MVAGGVGEVQNYASLPDIHSSNPSLSPLSQQTDNQPAYPQLSQQTTPSQQITPQQITQVSRQQNGLLFHTNLKNVPSLPVESLRSCLQSYKLGSFIEHVNKQAYEKIKIGLREGNYLTARVLILGPTGVGKTCLSLSLRTVFDDNGVQILNPMFGIGRERGDGVPTSSSHISQTFDFGKDGDVQHRLEFVDPMGFTNEQNINTEAIPMLKGECGIDPQRRNQRLINEYTNLLQTNFEGIRSHAALLVIGADLQKDSAELDSLKRLHSELSKYIPVLVVVTGTDLCPNYEHISRALHIPMAQLVPFVPYNTKNEERNEETDMQAMNILALGLHYAEYGLASTKLSLWQIIRSHAYDASRNIPSVAKRGARKVRENATRIEFIVVAMAVVILALVAYIVLGSVRR